MVSTKIILKISKREDYYRRRIFLKVMRNSENKEYLSFEKYQTQLELGRRLTLKQAYSSDSPINKSSSSSISFKRSQGLIFKIVFIIFFCIKIVSIWKTMQIPHWRKLPI